MKIGLITTTINVPTVLALYRKYGPDVRFFVAGDLNTPAEAYQFAAALNNCYCILPEAQKEWKCSDLIGWNCIQRRNIALLEALRWGAELIVSIDDDNIPLDRSYFFNFQGAVCLPFSGLLASSPTNWFDVGQLLQPRAPHRGFPHTKAAQPEIIACTDAKIGVVAGICLGDPDIGAVERIANAPTVHNTSELLKSGIVTDPRETWTVFNSQNTAFIRELAPAMFMIPGIGRHDDIFASLITQRVMREKGYHVHFGHPFVWQQRNQHDLVKDLKAEILGMEHVVGFAGYLDKNPVGDRSTIDYLRWLYDDLLHCVWWSEQASLAGLAFCDDVEKVL